MDEGLGKDGVPQRFLMVHWLRCWHMRVYCFLIVNYQAVAGGCCPVLMTSFEGEESWTGLTAVEEVGVVEEALSVVFS